MNKMKANTTSSSLRAFAFALSLLSCVVAMAQWSRVDAFILQGKPVSALNEAKKLQCEAKTPGERMQSLLCVGQLQQELTPDSFFAMVREIDRWHHTTESCSERAVTGIVMARLLESNAWRSQYHGVPADKRPADMREWSRKDYRDAAREYRQTAWNQPLDKLHAVKAVEWVPFVNIESVNRDVLKSKWWGEDLLHVIMEDAPDSVWKRVRRFYASQGLYEPEIEDYVRRRDTLEVCIEGVTLFPNEKRVALLTNSIMRIECPELSLQSQTSFYPGTGYVLGFKSKNVGSYTLQLYRMNGEPRNWRADTAVRNGVKVGQPQRETADAATGLRLKYTVPEVPGIYALVITPVPTRETKSIEPLVLPMRVSPWQLLQQGRPDGKTAFVVVDAMSGNPAEGQTVEVLAQDAVSWSGMTDSNGRAPLWSAFERQRGAQAVRIKGDASSSTYINVTRQYNAEDSEYKTHSIYTDRSVYRPGQTVHVGLLEYISKGCESHVGKGTVVYLTMRDANGKVAGRDTLTTDAYGVDSTSFSIPKDAEPGMWTLRTERGFASFRVEEYKRPTFDVRLEQADNTDTSSVRLLLTAKSFAGMPIRGARVTGSYTLSQPWWWRMRYGYVPDKSEAIDTLATDASGQVVISLPRPSVGDRRFAALRLTACVVAASGETHEAEISVPLRRSGYAILANINSQQDRRKLDLWDVKLVDATGRTVEGDIFATVAAGKGGSSMRCGVKELPGRLAALPTDRYTVVFEHGTKGEERYAKSDTCSFTLFDTNDKHTPDTAWFYASADTLPCVLHVGSCLKDISIYYTLWDGERCLADTLLRVSDSAFSLPLDKASHTDGLSATFAFVKDERTYTWNSQLRNPLPKTQLQWHWDTFRDKTQPGNHEKWSGTLLRPDGTAAPANVMLTVYDASLDAVYGHDWHLRRNMPQHLSWCSWNATASRWQKRRFQATFTLPLLYEPQLISHHFSHKYFGVSAVEEMAMSRSPRLLMSAAYDSGPKESAMKKQASVLREAVVTNDAEEKSCDEAVAGGVIVGQEPQAVPVIRENFDELAVFAPCLRTDANGRFTIDFTLPQSVTTWHLLGVAHTADMQTGTTSLQCVAQKDVMVQVGTPRFLRLGDEGCVTATVSCLTDSLPNGTLTVEVLDGESGQSVSKSVFSFVADTVFTVAVPAQTTAGFMVRATAMAGNHTDGEQRFVPVIDSRTWVTETVDMLCYGKGQREFAMPELPKAESENAHLVFNPAPVWTAVSALPALMEPDEKDAVSLTNAYFANVLTRHLANTIPQVQEYRRFDMQALQSQAEAWHKSLAGLQNEDGSFSWFAGGHGSTFITTEVAVELARLSQLTGTESPLLPKAMKYLSREVDERIKWMKTNKVQYVDELSFYYLYAAAMAGYKATQSGYLLPLVADNLVHYSMQQRTMAAVILYRNNRIKDARCFIESVDEHIVSTPERGSYFDYPGGSFTCIDRKLQTLTTAIEAKTLLGDNVYLKGLRRNLLQQRRVQGWESRLFTTAAVAAVLGNGEKLCKAPGYTIALQPGGSHEVRTDTVISLPEVPRRLAVTSADASADAEAWGALFINRLQQNASVVASATGLSVRCDMPSSARIGDRLTMKYVITADRDYEWVRLNVPRPACLEAADQLSGYACQGGLFYYRSQHDDRESLFFERLPRGTYIIESTCFADRRGRYTSGIATIECLYAPEYTGHSANSSLEVK